MSNTLTLAIALFAGALVILSCDICIEGTMTCPNCGNMTVPYPLSTGPSCGDQSYKVRCSFGTLFFDALNGSSYVITSINPQSQRLVIRPSNWVDHACMSVDYMSQGISLDPSLPFNITSSNTLVLMNCSTIVLTLALDCTPTSICHAYLRDNPLAAASCGAFPLCCSVTTGGSQNEHRIRVRPDRCAAYQSFVNLDTSLPVSKWVAFSGLELEWELPQEPLCTSQADCQNSANSLCSVEHVKAVQKRCFCQSGFRWDPIAGVCYKFRQFDPKLSPIFAGLTLSTAAVLFGFAVLFVVHRQRERIRREAQLRLTKMREDILNANSSGKAAKIFTGKEITRATGNFSWENLLGTGGFGEVFKGTLDNGTVIAVKRAKLGNTKGIDQILNEVRILCQVNHRSMVRLLGCCVDLELPLLIYEYIPYGNLFDHLHGQYKCKWAPLTWYRRLIIAHQTAEGLAYLHTSAVPPIFHRDIKSSNILLDEKLDAKVSDFGLSRLAETDATHITTCAQGTLGYLDPEYYLNFQLIDKSDVYSFGVVLLELLTSKKAIDFNRDEEEVNLAIHIKKILKEERLMDAVDPAIKEGATKLELETMKALGYLASSCLDERRHNRPNMKEVADEIEYIISILQGG
ncbi:wall-associated receptor kinase-like 20 isoform X2 [Syzygium oleosum]|uniref:wall-associated receptor kinase-like 20 isoform X2 n=1 Tax=Syzygium oleosum TaxID=219896 RepID=UPI0011D247DD|nr:wall-associated receptor kinase-like 20 isoform X2 [Syzygium oleosum]